MIGPTIDYKNESLLTHTAEVKADRLREAEEQVQECQADLAKVQVYEKQEKQYAEKTASGYGANRDSKYAAIAELEEKQRQHFRTALFDPTADTRDARQDIFRLENLITFYSGVMAHYDQVIRPAATQNLRRASALIYRAQGNLAMAQALVAAIHRHNAAAELARIDGMATVGTGGKAHELLLLGVSWHARAAEMEVLIATEDSRIRTQKAIA